MDRRNVLCLMVVVVCLMFAGLADAQCPGGQCGPVQKSVLKTLDGVRRVAQPVVNRAVVRKLVTRRGVIHRIFARR